MSAGVGFTGINEVITGIRYNGSKSGIEKFEGPSLGSSYSLGVSAGSFANGFFKVKASVGVGISKKADADFTNIDNLAPCPFNMVEINNATKSYSFQIGASASVLAGILELTAAFSTDRIATYSWGSSGTYRKFGSDRSLAGTRMAQEILLTQAMTGIYTAKTGFDLTAAAISILFRDLDFSNCPPDKPSIGTKAIKNVSSTEAEGGGIITYDGGSSVINRGVCWSTSYNPIVTNSHTVDGSGTGNFNSKITGLSQNTTYYVRAYATNSVGTTYGTQESFTTSSGSGTIPTNGLVAYYPFNGNANDLSGNSNHGTPNGVTPTPDRHGSSNSAYLFDGIDDYIEINHSASLNLSQQISISYWVKFETSADYYWPYHIIEKYGCWGTGQRENDLSWGVETADGPFNIFTINYLYNRYYHIVQVYDGTKIYTYCDGVLKGSANASGLLKQNTNKVYISRYNFGGNYFFDGTLDDFRIYNRALTQQEITALFNE